MVCLVDESSIRPNFGEEGGLREKYIKVSFEELLRVLYCRKVVKNWSPKTEGLRSLRIDIMAHEHSWKSKRNYRFGKKVYTYKCRDIRCGEEKQAGRKLPGY